MRAIDNFRKSLTPHHTGIGYKYPARAFVAWLMIISVLLSAIASFAVAVAVVGPVMLVFGAVFLIAFLAYATTRDLPDEKAPKPEKDRSVFEAW